MDYTELALAPGDGPKNVIIIGGSVCGLMHGIMIKRLGHNVHIIEQSQTEARTGFAAGIMAGPKVVEFLKRFDASAQPYSIPCAAQFISRESTVRWRINAKAQMTGWDVLYYRLRANFDGFVSKHCPEPIAKQQGEGSIKYDYGKRVSGVTYTDGLMEVVFEDLINGGGGTLHADLVIAADGTNSTVRQTLLPEPQRPYSGYVAWRGTVPEKEISAETIKFLDGYASAFAMRSAYMLCYIIPGENGTLEKGERLFNYLWYYNVDEDSEEFADIMTDVDGHKHRHTLPIGKMRDDVWKRQKAKGRELLPTPYVELMAKTKHPFISAIRDNQAPKAAFYGGRLLIVGDALALFRPHVGASTNQGVVHCLALEKVLKGEMTVAEWEAEVLRYASKMRYLSVLVGTWFQFGYLATIKCLISGGLAVLRAMFSRFW